MRNKIDYGIDLGTTNSVIARMENGVPLIIKTDTLKDTLPSCVHFTRKKDILVGDQAVNAMKNDNVRALRNFEKNKSNTFMEFKRTMGTSTTYYSFNMDKEFTSEELSAEVLKKLKTFIKDENFSSIVITIPAKFLNPQCEATMKAAKLAGFEQVQLLQEPVAAATAYGIHSKIKDGYLLVFDFGGGTFDAALLKSEEGILSIKDTEGNNFLGGKNIDEAIVDKIIIPYLKKKYKINNILNIPEKREILRNALKPYAEEAKIQLSFRNSYNILSNLGDLPFLDENGEEPEIDITIGQKEIEEIVSPIFQKSIDITKSLLRRNNLNGSDISALILVGGPTYSPILRRMLKEQITEKVDTSLDPMTVVAKGAALFASTVSISEELKDRKRDKTKLQLEIKYEATSTETEELINIKLLKDKIEGKIPEKLFVEIVRKKPEGYSTNKKFLSEKPNLLEVILEKNCPNEFEINIYNEAGDKLECEPSKFTILQGIGGVESMQVLPYHIMIVKYFIGEEKDLVYPIKGLEKNKSIKSGITGIVDNLKTRRDIRPGVKEDIIRVPIYQGEYNAEGTNPELNFHIKDVIISGETIPKFLPAGSPVNIRIKIDSSSLMTFIAEFPTIEHEEEVKIEIKQTEPPSQKSLYDKIVDAINIAHKVKREDLLKNLTRLKEDIYDIGTTEDGRLRIMEEYRKNLIELDKTTRELEWPRLENELRETYFRVEDLVQIIKKNPNFEDINIKRIEEDLAEYRDRIEQTIKEKEIKEAKVLILEITNYYIDLQNAITGNAMDAEFIKYFDETFNDVHWKNPTKARQLINQGLQMITNGNLRNLRSILAELIVLIPQDQIPDTLQ